MCRKVQVFKRIASLGLLSRNGSKWAQMNWVKNESCSIPKIPHNELDFELNSKSDAMLPVNLKSRKSFKTQQIYLISIINTQTKTLGT